MFHSALSLTLKPLIRLKCAEVELVNDEGQTWYSGDPVSVSKSLCFNTSQPAVFLHKVSKLFLYCLIIMIHDFSVNKVTGYGLDGRDSIPIGDTVFSLATFRPSLEPTLPLSWSLTFLASLSVSCLQSLHFLSAPELFWQAYVKSAF